jgi:hypothetical protein
VVRVTLYFLLGFLGTNIGLNQIKRVGRAVMKPNHFSIPGLIALLIIILFICAPTSNLHSQPQQGAAREKRAVQFTAYLGIMDLTTLKPGGG